MIYKNYICNNIMEISGLDFLINMLSYLAGLGSGYLL